VKSADPHGVPASRIVSEKANAWIERIALLLYVGGLVAVGITLAVPTLAWLSPLAFGLLIPAGAIFGWIRDGRSPADLGFRFSARWLLRLAAGLLLGLAIPILFQVIQIAGGWIALTSRPEPPGNFSSYLFLLLLKMLFLVAIEELVFRGFFIQTLGRKTGTGLAVLLASLLWGTGHLASMAAAGVEPGLMAIGMVTFILWGILLSIGFLKTDKSLWLPYGIHLGINLSFSLKGWFFVTERNAPLWWTGHPAFQPETGLIGVLVWGALAAGISGCFAILGRKGSRKN
jgi:membrane protease YdiL (CAAX protease family)